MVCRLLRRTSATTRHDRVLYLLARLTRTVEIAGGSEPDANFFLHTRRIATDVSIIYSELVSAEGLDFIPFVLETFGGFGKDATSLLDTLMDEGLLKGVDNLGGMRERTFITRALSICLQGGNALMLQDGCAMTRRAASRDS